MNKILVLHGVNLNMLGMREQSTYGTQTLDSINRNIAAKAKQLKFELSCQQHNAEHALVETIQKAHKTIDFIIINPGAFTHTSVALRDALLAVNIPFAEVHISNIFKRESFRHRSYLSDIAVGVIAGFGSFGYELALLAAQDYLQTHSNRRGQS